jgi:alpha-galactosidase
MNKFTIRNLACIFILTYVIPVKASIDPPTGDNICLLSSLDITKGTTGWGHSIVKDKSFDGNAITLKGTVYTSGIGTHATSTLIVKVNGAKHFHTTLGVDDEVKKMDTSTHGICDYNIIRDDNTIIKSGTIKATDAAAVDIDLDVSGWQYLTLQVLQGAENWGDHVDWANAYFEFTGKAPITVTDGEKQNGTLTLACAKHFYAQPGIRLMNKLRTSNPNAEIEVTGLPQGLTFNGERDLVEGTIQTPGIYTYTVNASDSDGNTLSEPITLEITKNMVSPTPLMGWLSWNVFESSVAEDTVKAIADAFINYKLPDYGYRYVCIDDLWQGTRAADGTPQWNAKQFPNGIKAVADYVHDKGLKFGIYSDAATQTCGGAFGSYGYETKDATAYAQWGCDLLKYDYCGAPADSATAKVRYKTMSNALKATNRPFFFYICEWGARQPWTWAADCGGHCWRISYDSRDTWTYGPDALSKGLIGVLEGIECIKNLSYYAGPNRFNDADMMMVGLHGKGKSSSYSGAKGMTQIEYQSQFSLWCMFSSPLTLSFDLRKILNADLAIITNSEVIALDQDPMGQQAQLIAAKDSFDYYMKDLENGDIAIAVFNRSDRTKRFTVDLSKFFLDTNNRYVIRDLWKHNYLDTINTSFNSFAQGHETKVFRVSQYKGSDTSIKQVEQQLHPTLFKSKNGLRILCDGLPNYEKRILITDTAGYVVGSARGKESSFEVNIPHRNKVYLVNIICAGHAQCLKTIL